ncbi:MAG: hypothetical protein A2X35_11495 [Elusimicrobia bacterium GWA2_61_42]|nr:MAG: hypothetical protein A2X35_11495 [Elusimicrobia bacterium GWA2_61_42]OGR75840.1 MAG: hypothetical protein A2X38_07420 [Elusimicrobia bacterium GWC2_61_25]
MFLLFGFFSLLAQVLLLREISQVFTAHELSLAAALASWLLWTAAGARLAPRAGARGWDFGAGALLFAALAPAGTLLARLAPSLLPGLSQPGLFTMLAGSLLLTFPAGLANGLAVGLALPGRPARFYAAEAAGAAAAGLFTVCYFRYFPGLPVIAALAAPALLLAGGCAAQKPFQPRRLAAAAAAAAALGLAAWAQPFCWTLKPPAPKPARVIQTQGSRLALAGGKELSFYEDGRLLHAPESAAAEELAHLPLLALKKPRRVLLSGSGAFFLLPEVLKHKPAAIDIAEPDSFKAAALARETQADERTFTLLRSDARLLKPKTGGYAAIFQTASAPENAALNRYFTVEYFRAAAALLRPGGLLVFQLPFAENYVPGETAYAAACVLASAQTVFDFVELIPGARLTVLVSDKSIRLDPAALAAAYAARGIRNRTVVPSAFSFMLDPYRRAWAAGELARVKNAPLNTDLNPLAYFRFWRVWLSMVASPASLLGLLALAGCALYAAAKAAALLGFTPENRSGEAFFMGFWALAFETALLLAYHAKTGRLAPELGLLFAVFMAGGSAGAWAGRNGRGNLAAAELAAAAAAFGCAAAAPALLSGGAPVWLLITGSGFITGYFFARAAGSRPRDVYALDLIGGAAGGFIAAGFAAPLGGIRGAFLLAGLAAACALAGAARVYFSAKASTVKV